MAKAGLFKCEVTSGRQSTPGSAPNKERRKLSGSEHKLYLKNKKTKLFHESHNNFMVIRQPLILFLELQELFQCFT